MDWVTTILFLFSALIVLMLTGMPVAICFMLINVVGVFVFLGGTLGLEQLTLSFYSSLATFTLLPVSLFILMGEVMFHSGLGTNVINLADKWFGRLPGRLALLSTGAGTILATLTGLSLASMSILGSVLVPEMEKRGYKEPMSVGPIMGSGGLAIMIPPSSLGVLLGALGQISVGKILIAIIVPGLLMAVFYSSYIVIRCSLQPSIAPPYRVPHTPLSERLLFTLREIIPIAFIIFMVIGVIFIGVCTPSEAAATGTSAVIVVTLLTKRFSWEVLKKSLSGTLVITGMIFLIIAGASAYGQILSYSGATRGITGIIGTLSVSPILIVIVMQFIILILGCFMEPVGIMMITLPIFVPAIEALGLPLVWFAVMVLLNIEMAMLTPPLGFGYFVMKGVAPPGTTMGGLYRAALPFLALDALVMVLIMAFPQIALWLPNQMG